MQQWLVQQPQIERRNTLLAEVFRIPNFLTAEECKALIELGEPLLGDSTLTTQEPDQEFRTSQTAHLWPTSSLVLDIDAKISRHLHIDPVLGEVTQAQRYLPGQQFKRHTDYFSPKNSEYARYAGERGQRTWTFMIYLNTVEAGGATEFPLLDFKQSAETGMALAWRNLLADGQGNPNTLHAGLPVEQGVKWVITKWFRQHPQPTPAHILRPAAV